MDLLYTKYFGIGINGTCQWIVYIREGKKEVNDDSCFLWMVVPLTEVVETGEKQSEVCWKGIKSSDLGILSLICLPDIQMEI